MTEMYSWSNMYDMKKFKNSNELRVTRIKERDKIFKKLVGIFSEIAVEAHVFGSLTKGTSDEFSDIDFWATFDDENIKNILDKRIEIFSEIGKILIYHEAQQNFPLGGTYTLLLFKTVAGPIHVDIYLSPIDSARLFGESKILFNKIDLKLEDGMMYDPKREKRDAQDRVKFIVCMAFNGIKKLARRNDDKFLDFLTGIYNDLRMESFNEMEVVENTNTSKTVENVLANLSQIADTNNKIAIRYINDYFAIIKTLRGWTS